MKVQSFKDFSQPKMLQRPEAARPGPEPEDNSSILQDRRETFEIITSSLLIGLVCGVSAHELGPVSGAASGVAAATAGSALYGFTSSSKDGFNRLGALAGGLSGLVMGAAGATGAAIGGLTGHPIVGGLVAGGAMAAWGAYQQSR